MIFQIWSEGYSCTGMEGRNSPAMLHGSVEAETFRQACDIYFIEQDTETKQGQRFYNSDRLTYWGCKLFDNEAEARESFG